MEQVQSVERIVVPAHGRTSMGMRRGRRDMASRKALLFEAYRRNAMARTHDRAEPLLQRWLGLGTASAYATALNAGLMRFYDGQTPPPRCMGWLCLTEAGIAEMEAHAKEFAAVLEDMKQHGYSQSIIGQYMLAGGITG